MTSDCLNDGMGKDSIVEVSDLTVRFGDFTAVDGVSFNVRRGEVFAFLGPNGAGKTTTIRTITTIQRATSGRVVIDGFDIDTNRLEARRRIGIAQQHISLDNELTVAQNIRHHAMLHKIPRSEYRTRVLPIASGLGLDPYMSRRVSDLSGGWKRRAAITCAILHEPSVLFLDEPTAGLDTQSRHILWDLVRDLNAGGTTVFLTTHYMDEAEALCDRVAIISSGRISAIGTVDELRESVGPYTVEVTEGSKVAVTRHPTLEDARAYAESLGDVLCNVRLTNLEDVFLDISGGKCLVDHRCHR